MSHWENPNSSSFIFPPENRDYYSANFNNNIATPVVANVFRPLNSLAYTQLEINSSSVHSTPVENNVPDRLINKEICRDSTAYSSSGETGNISVELIVNRP